MSDGDGGYTTELMQTGEVTAIRDTVLGNGSSGSDIEKGDDVTIVAAVSGDTATADSVSEAGRLGRPPGQN